MKKKNFLSAIVVSAILGVVSFTSYAMKEEERDVVSAVASVVHGPAAAPESQVEVVTAASRGALKVEQKGLFEEEARLLMERFSLPAKSVRIKEVYAALHAKAGVLLPFLTRDFDLTMVDPEGKLLIAETELKFYRWLYAYGIEVSYRPEPISDFFSGDTWRRNTFYESGTVVGIINYDSLQPGRFFQLYKTNDIYRIRYALCRWELESPASSNESFSKPILITPNSKDGHTFPIMHILDLKQHRVLCSLAVNSWVNNSYFEIMAEYFNLRNYYFISLDGVSSKDRIEQIPEAVIIDKKVVCNWSMPFFDASYSLQTQKDDSNCVLYTYNVTLAFLSLFEDESVVQFLIEQARIIFENPKSLEAKEAVDAVKSILHNGLKKFLPQYYTPTGERRSFEEVRAYHLKMRWDITSDFLRRTLLN